MTNRLRKISGLYVDNFISCMTTVYNNASLNFITKIKSDDICLETHKQTDKHLFDLFMYFVES
jgi:hypothetical protein